MASKKEISDATALPTRPTSGNNDDNGGIGGGSGQSCQNDQSGDAESQVAAFYEGRCVLVTGASGFLGKLIIEKLLRACTGVRKIFVLIRARKQKTARERLGAIFESAIFDTLRARTQAHEFQRLCDKVILLEGDLTQAALGLSIERLLQLADECSIILHAGALVSFEQAKLRHSVNTNLAGTHNVLELAKRLPRLRALVHVSTCYSNCVQKRVGEHIYPVNVDPRALIGIAQTLEHDDESLARIGGRLRGNHPNFYTYTKHLAEFLCAEYASGPDQLPVVVCRPSIVISTHDEPERAFVDNRNAGNGMFDGVARGLMRSVHGSPDTIMDQVPADFVVNCILALGWFCDLYQRVRVRTERPRPLGSAAACESTVADSGAGVRAVNIQDALVRIDDKVLEEKMVEFYAQRQRSASVTAIELGLDQRLLQMPVFHVSSGLENPITFNEMFAHVAKHSLKFPSLELFRQPGCTMHKSALVNKLCTFVQHTCVGRLLDLVGAPPRPQVDKRSSTWTREFKRLDKFNGVLPYFYLNSFKFQPDNRVHLIERLMNEADRRLFNCDIRQVNWDSFARDITHGHRRHLAGEPDSTLPEARAKLSGTLLRNTLLQAILMALACYLVLSVVL